MPVDDTVLVVIGGIFASALAASLSYYLTKRREIEIMQIEKKLSLYDGLLTAFTKWSNYKTNETLSNFLTECYRAGSYASDEVLQATRNLLVELEKNRKDSKGQEILIRALYNAIRHDVNPKNKPFEFRIFSSFQGN